MTSKLSDANLRMRRVLLGQRLQQKRTLKGEGPVLVWPKRGQTEEGSGRAGRGSESIEEREQAGDLSAT